jgi:lysophospholipase L1-like esterase
MKKILLILLFIPFILKGVDKSDDQSIKFNQYIIVKDSLTAGYLLLPRKSSYPSNPGRDKIINYNGTLQRYNGSTWLPLIGYTAENLANKGIANGYASLDATGKIPSSQITPVPLGYTFVESSMAGMLGLSTAAVGDICKRTDSTTVFILRDLPASTYNNWILLNTSVDNPVTSVNGQSGIVVLDAADVGAIAVESDPVWLSDSSDYYKKVDILGLLTHKVNDTTQINGHALNGRVIISATDIITGTLPHAQLPALDSADIPNNGANTTGTAGGLKTAYLDWTSNTGGNMILNKPNVVLQGDSTSLYYSHHTADSLLNRKQNKLDTTTYDATKTDVALERNARNDSISDLRNLANSKTIYGQNGIVKEDSLLKLGASDNIGYFNSVDLRGDTLGYFSIEDSATGGDVYQLSLSENGWVFASKGIGIQGESGSDTSVRIGTGRGQIVFKNRNIYKSNATHPPDSSRYLVKYEIDSIFNSNIQQNILLAGTSPGAYILTSSDNGSTWTNNGSSEKGQPLDILYHNYVYYTTDQGYIINYNTGFYYNYSASPIRCITNHEDTIYAGNDAGNLIYSINQGISFSLYSSLSYRINELLYTDRLLCFTSNGIYRATGTLVQAGNFTCALRATIDTLYTVRADGYVFMSVNRGASWANLGDFGLANSRFIERGFGSRIIVGYTSTVMLYTDDQFATTGSLSDQEPEAKCLVKTLDRIIIGQSQVPTTGGGMISYSINNGSTFTNLGTQYSQDSINCMISYTGSSYVVPSDLSAYKLKSEAIADTTLQRAWMDGLEARKLAKADTNHFLNEKDTLDNILTLKNLPKKTIDSLVLAGSTVFGNVLKNSNGILKWGNYNIKTTNSIVQIHPLGLSEYVGNSVYFAYGVAARTQVVSNIEVNRIKVKLYLWTGTPACELRIYVKNTAFETAHPLSYNSTLVYTKSYAAGEFNTVAGNYTIIDLPSTLSLTAGQWVFVSVAEAGTNAPALRMWTTQNSLSDRVSLLLCTSSTGQYTANWYTGGAGYYSTPILFEFAEGVTQAEFAALEDKVDSIDGVKQDIASIDPYMPDTIFTAIGRELNIYNDAFIQLRPDYKIEFTTSPNHGYAQNRGYRIHDTCVGLWSTTLTAKIYDENLSLLESKSTIIKHIDTIPIAGSSSKKILVLGNSLTENSIWITELNKLLKLNKDTLTFLGTKGTAPNKHYATSGWSFSTFTGASSSFHISGITNVKAYINDSCSSATLDYVVINLGINDVGVSGVEKTDAQITTIVNNADSLVKSIRHATYGFPNCKIIISLSPIGNVDYDAFAVSYGSLASPLIYEKNLRKLHKALSTKYLNTNNTWVCPTYYNIDRTYGYTYTTTTKACARCSETITTHTNGVHPTTQGYMQMADIIFSYVRKALNSRK